MNIKDILVEHPAHTPLFSSYLKKNGLSHQLLNYYENEGWLEKVSSGLYKKKNDQLSLFSVVQAVQKQLGSNAYVGGPTALEENNITFNIRFEKPFYLFYPKSEHLGVWVKAFKSIVSAPTNLFAKRTLGLREKNGVVIATPERAIIETVSLIPKHVEMEEAQHLMELLPTLRSKLLQELLEDCTSIITKRLFFHLAEKVAPPWLIKLHLNKINFGTGVRQLVKGGQYDKKYQLYV